MRLTTILSLLCLCSCATGMAQTVERDPVTGDYRITYVANDGETYTVVVVATDKVDPVVDVQVVSDAGAFRYRYTVSQRQSQRAVQTVHSVNLPCPPDDPQLSLSAPAPWSGRTRPVASGLLACRFARYRRPAVKGEPTEGLELVSSWLPGVGEARIQGLAEMPMIESGESTPREVGQLVMDLVTTGPGGSWYGLRVVAPNRPPETMADPGAALDEIAADLNQACDLDWVGRPPGVCNSLQVKLDAAASSLAQGDTTSAAEQLQAFVNELDAQRGQHVSENAYWLLKVNVEYVLERLQA